MTIKEYRKQTVGFSCKYLGQFEVQYKDDEDHGEGAAYVEDNKGRVHFLNDFLRIENKKTSFHGNHVTSYFSAYTCIVDDSGESLKLFLLYW